MTCTLYRYESISFDYITIFEVLEHISNAEQAIIRIRDTFKSKIAFISIPNSGSLYARIRLLRGRFPKQWVVHPGEHVRFWTLHDFNFMINGLGIEVIKCIRKIVLEIIGHIRSRKVL